MTASGQQSRLVPQLHRPSPPLCPVTALAFYRARQSLVHGSDEDTTFSSSQATSLYVLAGEDGWLSIYSLDKKSRKEGTTPAATAAAGHCLGRLRVFAEQAIQGCRVGSSCSAERAGLEQAEHTPDGDVLVWGGRSVALISQAHIEGLLERASGDDAKEREEDIPSVKEVQAPDWIYDGLLPSRQSRKSPSPLGALITAHNEVVPFRVDRANDKSLPTLVVSKEPSISPSRPVLYSAQLAWAEDDGPSNNGSDRLLVAAGTVFGEIVVWTCSMTTNSATDASHGIEVLAVFIGHEGSIFDVALSPHLEFNHGPGDPSPPTKVRVLATCSDDRTVRVWPLYLNNDTKRNSDSIPMQDTNQARETGFQSTFDGIASRSQDEQASANTTQQVPSKAASEASSALAVEMGHVSRIWRVRFGAIAVLADSSSPRSIFLYSFGEDATTQEWRLDLDFAASNALARSPLSGSLQHLRTLPCHTGKNIWAAAVSLSKPPLVASGACDGKICLFRGAPGIQSGPAQESTIVASTVPPRPSPTFPAEPGTQTGTPQLPRGKDKPPKGSQKRFRQEVFNSYAFLSENRMLAVTTYGRLLLGSPSEESAAAESTWIWAEIPNMPDMTVAELQDYNVVRSPRGGGGGGVAALPEVEDIAIIGSQTGKLFMYSALAGVQELPVHLPGKVDEIIFLPEERRPSTVVLRLQILVTVLFQDEVTLLYVDVDTAKGAFISHTSRTLHLPKKAPTSPSSVVITAASRCGSYLILGSRTGQLCVYKPDQADTVEGSSFSLTCQTQTRTRDAILSIVPLPPAPGSLVSSAFVMTARDGTYRIYEMVDDETTTVNLCKRHETAPPFGPIVRDAWFIQGDDSEHPELVLCGFRSTKFIVWNETRQQTLATVECGGTHRAHTYLFSPSDMGRLRFAFTRNSNLHIFAQAASAMTTAKTGGHGREIRAVRTSATGRYIATGGEDTVVRIWASTSPPRCLSVLKLHNTGLHGLVWLGDHCLVSAAGSEELFVWRIADLPSAYAGLAVLCESAYPDSTDDKVLRITGLDASQEERTDSATSSTMYISVALSNSVLKTYHYSQSDGWRLLAQGRYTGACPMQVRHLQLNKGTGSLDILAAFADGNLTVWNAAYAGNEDRPYGDYTLQSTSQAHRNAVKTLDLSSVTSNTSSPPWLDIVSGGDDNAIAVTRLSCTSNGGSRQYTFHKTFRVSNAHAAAITGIQVLPDAQDGSTSAGVTVVTCSNDQRIKAWRILLGPEQNSNVQESSRLRIQLLDNRDSAVADPGDLDCISGLDNPSAIVVGIGMETWSLG